MFVDRRDSLLDEIFDLTLGCVGCGAGRFDADICNSCNIQTRISVLRYEYDILEDLCYLGYLGE